MIAYFLGANSPKGFYSLYDGLMERERARAFYILKGGAGCGKSTCMRAVGAAAERAGQRPEYILCSGDPDSLDAVVLPDSAAALVDGTAPHVVEPKLPGAVDSYVNLGACYDRAGLAPLRRELEGAMAGYKGCYERAYRCLAAAAGIRADCRSLLSTPTMEAKLLRRLKGLAARELRRCPGAQGTCRERFLSAVTCQGAVCLWDTVAQLCPRVYELEDSYALSHPLLSALREAALAAGQEVVACPSPMEPERLEHLLLPGLGVAFVTSSPELPYPGKAYRRIRVDAMVDAELLRRSRPRLRFARKVSAALVEEAVASLAEAKAMHDKLEALYHPHVDFERVQAISAELIDELGL